MLVGATRNRNANGPEGLSVTLHPERTFSPPPVAVGTETAYMERVSAETLALRSVHRRRWRERQTLQRLANWQDVIRRTIAKADALSEQRRVAA